MRIAIAAVLVAACSGGKDEPRSPPSSDFVRGTLAIDGAPVAITACRPGRDTAIYADLVTARGTLRWLAYEEQRMLWDGAPLVCSRLTRTWGGGTRPTDRTTYLRAELAFTCTGPVGEVRGELELECGNIDPTERKLLDHSRQRHLDDREKR